MPGILNELYHTEDFDRCWPSWQEEIEGRNLVHIEVPCSIESLFEALFHSNAPFQVDIGLLFHLVKKRCCCRNERKMLDE